MSISATRRRVQGSAGATVPAVAATVVAIVVCGLLLAPTAAADFAGGTLAPDKDAAVVRVAAGTGSLHRARAAARAALAAARERGTPARVEVVLGPGVHHIGSSGPLVLGHDDCGADADHPVVWRSADESNPAVVGAPIPVTGWAQHPSVPRAMVATIPPNVTRGATLRHFWVNGRRAARPVAFACGGGGHVHGSPGGCNNATSHPQFTFAFEVVDGTAAYPEGSRYETFGNSTAGNPAAWRNPDDVEFVYTSCAGFNCWVEPRCGVESVDGTKVTLRQREGNETCWHRLYYFGIGWGGKPEGRAPITPTSIENIWDPATFSTPGTFYYDRDNATITYLPRPGETTAVLEATATTATAETILVANRTRNVRWRGVRFAYATSLHASGPRGFVDTQSGYLYRDGEPPVNVNVTASTNVTFDSCDFRHLGAVYAIGAAQASQGVVVSNCTFADCSGGAVKLGSVGERGYPAPPVDTPPAKQDRGFVVSDCETDSIPVEYGSANPIFGGYIADAVVAHNTIKRSSYSGVCLGWGWGLSSYMRNVHALNNSIKDPMLRLADGGGLYTNTPCPNCNVSGNVFQNDNVVYGCLYHDGGSAQWYDVNNVFNHVHTPSVFGHGSCPDIVVTDLYMNDSHAPNLQGATNFALRGPNGTCVAPRFVTPPSGGFWSSWPPEAAAIVANAGRRDGPLPDPVAPALSPPAAPLPPGGNACVRLGVQPCDPTNMAQRWWLTTNGNAGSTAAPGSAGGSPVFGVPTLVKSAVRTNATTHSCWRAQFSRQQPSNTCGLHSSRVLCEDGGCLPLPPHAHGLPGGCDRAAAWVFHANGTVTSDQPSADNRGGAPRVLCVSAGSSMASADGGGGAGGNTALGLDPCSGAPSQRWSFQSNSDGTFTLEQNETCVTNNFFEAGGGPVAE